MASVESAGGTRNGSAPRDPANTAAVPGWLVELRSNLREVSREVDMREPRERRMAMRDLRERVERDVLALEHAERGRGLAWFRTADGSLDHRVTLQLPPLGTLAGWGQPALHLAAGRGRRARPPGRRGSSYGPTDRPWPRGCWPPWWPSRPPTRCSPAQIPCQRPGSEDHHGQSWLVACAGGTSGSGIGGGTSIRGPHLLHHEFTPTGLYESKLRPTGEASGTWRP